jgi:hypothetical protein
MSDKGSPAEELARLKSIIGDIVEISAWAPEAGDVQAWRAHHTKVHYRLVAATYFAAEAITPDDHRRLTVQTEPKDLVPAGVDKVLAEIDEMTATLRNDMQEVNDALSAVERAVASLGGTIAARQKRRAINALELKSESSETRKGTDPA